MLRKKLDKATAWADRFLFGKPVRLNDMFNPYANPEDRNPAVAGEWHMVEVWAKKVDEPRVKDNPKLRNEMFEKHLRPAQKTAMVAEAAEAWDDLLAAIASHKKKKVREAIPKAVYYAKQATLFYDVPLDTKLLRAAVTSLSDYFVVDCYAYTLDI